MVRRSRRGTKAALFWADSLHSGIATWTTLSVRVPQLVTGTMSAAETQRMVAEKLAAAVEGALAGATTATRLALRSPRRLTSSRITAQALTMLEATSKPARRRVQANARRLTKKPK